MKKNLIYLTLGVLLGVIIPLLPLGFLFTQTGINSIGGLSQIREQTSELTAFEKDITFTGLSPLQSSMMHAGILFVFSLFLALGFYSISKKRIMAKL